MNLCACDSEEREHGVGVGVNATMLSETLEVVGLTEAVRNTRGCRARRSCQKVVLVAKKPMNPCSYDNEEREHGDDRE